MSYFGKMLHSVSNVPRSLGRSLSRSYIPELDGLRFIALMLVLLWHSSIRATRYSERIASTDGFYSLFPHGEIGVLLFFFISGYVVSQPFLNRPVQEWNVRSFYARRFIRIYPPYFIALSLCFFVLYFVGHVPQDAKSFGSAGISLTSSYLASIFYAHSFLFDAPSRLNPPIWSLELEIVFYALAPILLFFYVRLSSKIIRLLGLGFFILGLMVITAFVASKFQIDGRFRWGALTHSYLFLFGVFAADVSGAVLMHSRKKTTLADLAFLLGFLGLIVVGLEMTRVDARLSGGAYTFSVQMSTLCLLALILFGAFYGRISSHFLSLSWIGLVGTMCYSIYLSHIVTMQVVSEILGRLVWISEPKIIWLVWLSVLIPISLVVGFCFYILIERPFASAAKGPLRTDSLLPKPVRNV